MLNPAYGRGDFIVATFPTKEEYDKHKLELPANSLALIEEFPIDKEYVDNTAINVLSEAKTYIDEQLKNYYTKVEIDEKTRGELGECSGPFTFTKQYKTKAEMMNDKDNIAELSFVLISSPEGEPKDVDNGKLYQKKNKNFVYIADLSRESEVNNNGSGGSASLRIWDFTNE